MIPQWPAEFRQVTFSDGFRSGPRGQRMVTAMEAGPPKTRRRGNKLRTIAFTDWFDANQRARFDRFWEEDLASGTLPFLYPDPHNNGFPLQDEAGNPVLDDLGNPMIIESWILCTFTTSEPAWSALGGEMFAPQFEVLELP